MERLSAFSESQNEETASISPSIGHVYSVLENDPSILRTNISGGSELLSQGLNFFSADTQPSSTTESLEDSLDSDMFSISDSSDDVELLDCNEAAYPILNNILNQLLAEFRTATQYQSSPGEDVGTSGPVPSTTDSTHPGNTSRSSGKRKPQQDEENGTGEDGSHPPPPKKMKPGQGEKSQKSFACPYLKWDPLKFRICCEKKLSRISDVKQHLHRKHTPAHYCPLCQVIFPDVDKLQGHLEVRNCTRQDSTMLVGVSIQQYRELHGKSKPNASGEDQWYAIWEILFPKDERPRCVYVDTDLAVELCHFRAYCESHGPAIMGEHIDSGPAWLSSQITEEQRQVLNRLIAQGLNTLFDTWRSRNSNSPASTTAKCQSNDNEQQSRYETPTSSHVDSGVVLRGHSSSEATSQRSEFPPMFRIPAASFTSQLVAANTRARSPSPVQDAPVAPNSTDVPSLPSASLSPTARDQGWDLGYQGFGYETRPHNMFENDFNFDAFPLLEDMSGTFP
jgi:hypothetical protein